MKGVTGIGHCAIRARNFDAMMAFYTQTLGFEEMYRLRNDEGAVRLGYVRVTDTQFLEVFPGGIGEEAPPPIHRGVSHICLTVEDIEDTIADLAARGVTLTRPLKTGPADRNRQAWIEDPEGNRFELMEMSPTGLQAQTIARMRRERGR